MSTRTFFGYKIVLISIPYRQSKCYNLLIVLNSINTRRNVFTTRTETRSRSDNHLDSTKAESTTKCISKRVRYDLINIREIMTYAVSQEQRLRYHSDRLKI